MVKNQAARTNFKPPDTNHKTQQHENYLTFSLYFSNDITTIKPRISFTRFTFRIHNIPSFHSDKYPLLKLLLAYPSGHFPGPSLNEPACDQ
jgi:hypothetical protein